MPVIIAGMHRSGTSMLSRMLNIVGVSLGDLSDLMPAAEWNQKGYWENKKFVEINERILSHFGGDWVPPPDLPVGWLDDPWVLALSEEASAFINKEFGGELGRVRDAVSWGWKDPRTSLTLPFWKRIVPDIRVVFCVRNPLDVARSLSRRDGLSKQEGLWAWHYYNAVLLRDTLPYERVFAIYEDYFTGVSRAATISPRSSRPDPSQGGANYLRPFAPVLAFLGLPDVTPEQDQAIREFIDRDLQHHASSLQDVLNDPEVHPATKNLYKGLLEAPDGALDAMLGGQDTGRDARATSGTGAEAGATVGTDIAELLAQIRTLIRGEDGDRRAREMRNERDHLQSVLDDVLQHRDLLQLQRDTLQAHVDMLLSRVDDLQAVLGSRAHRLASRATDLLRRG